MRALRPLPGRCPAYATGKSLNPKKVIQDLKAHWIAKAPWPFAAAKGEAFATPMIDGDGVSQDDLWSCTTCRHCMESCPMRIEHVDKIVDMRRHLVLMEGVMPQELVTLNKNLENNFNPWGVGWSGRNDWTGAARRGRPRVLTQEENPSFDVLLWVGCAGSLRRPLPARGGRALPADGHAPGSPTASSASRRSAAATPPAPPATSTSIRRWRGENIAAMDGLGVKKIVAPCPHCLKTLSKEYPQFGGNYEVVHHSRFLAGPRAQGRLQAVAPALRDENGHPPRLLLPLPLRRRDGGTPRPAGRGGGWSCGRWAAVAEGELLLRRGRRPHVDGGARHAHQQHARPRRPSPPAPRDLGTACPFCLTMLSDGVKAAGKEEETAVLDIAEILERAVA